MKIILMDSNDPEIEYKESENFILAYFLDFVAILHRDTYSIEMLKNNEIELTFRKF